MAIGHRSCIEMAFFSRIQQNQYTLYIKKNSVIHTQNIRRLATIKLSIEY